MNCKVEKTENANEVKLEITVEAEKFENAMKKVYFQNAKYINIPGFRKGKAPMNIVEKYYGAQIFYEDAFNDVATQAYDEALEENKIEYWSMMQTFLYWYWGTGSESSVSATHVIEQH